MPDDDKRRDVPGCPTREEALERTNASMDELFCPLLGGQCPSKCMFRTETHVTQSRKDIPYNPANDILGHDCRAFKKAVQCGCEHFKKKTSFVEYAEVVYEDRSYIKPRRY